MIVQINCVGREAEKTTPLSPSSRKLVQLNSPGMAPVAHAVPRGPGGGGKGQWGGGGGQWDDGSGQWGGACLRFL